MDHRHPGQDFSFPPPTQASDPALTSPMGPTPQSPNTQLTMNLLNNLLQMQGLENSIIQQQMSPTSPTLGQTSNASAANNGNNNGTGYPAHMLLEQQIKLTQLQQLQQLQNQIFQQQIALISGQSPSILPTPPNFDVSRQLGGTGASGSDQQGYTGLPTPGPSGEIRPQQPRDFVSPSGLVNYLEPLPHALVPPSPNKDSNARNQSNRQSPKPGTHHHHGSASNHELQRQLMALSQSASSSQVQQHHTQHPNSPNTFHPQQQRQQQSQRQQHDSMLQHQQTSMLSPNPFESNNLNQQHQYQHGFASHYQSHNHAAMPHSAPEHLAFNIYHGPVGSNNDSGSSNIPGLTLGPAGVALGQHRQRLSLSESPRYGAHSQQMHPGGAGSGALDQDISPLTSPWLGAQNSSSSRHRPSTSTGTGTGSNKRMASPSRDEGGSARKRQSPAIRPTLGMSVARLVRETGSTSPHVLPPNAKGRSPPLPMSAPDSHSGSVSPDNSVPGTTGDDAAGRSRSGSKARPFRGSKSTTSTPLLKSTVNSATAAGNTAHTRSRSRAAGQGASGYVPPVGGEGMHDTPSPVALDEADGVDRSMPPPPLPMGITAPSGGFEGPGSAGHSNMNSNSSSNATSNPNPNANSHSENSNTDASSHLNAASKSNANPTSIPDDRGSDDPAGAGSEGLSMDVDMMGNMNMMGMGIHFGEMGMESMEGMMGLGNIGGMGMQMDMGMGGMGMNSYGAEMGGIGMMDMGGIDFGQSQAQQQHHQQQEKLAQEYSQERPSVAGGEDDSQNKHLPLVPVTPASIMNLGRLGINPGAGNNGRLGSASTTAGPSSAHEPNTSGSASTQANAPQNTGKKAKQGSTRGGPPGTGDMTTRSGRTSGRKAAPAASPSLKPILPAGGMPSTSDPTLPSPRIVPSLPSSPALGAGPPGVRKTSHKAAEQKRRDSLKLTFDGLRMLLPPIALPNDADADPRSITSPLFHPTAPLLPGALPPRGPPKAGGEGPNKGVSKLQLLICGNEYIRILKARVERRDEEIARLRQEVRQLRAGEEVAEMVDLDLDLDEVERRDAAGPVAQGQVSGEKDGGGDDGMDDGDDDDD